MIFSYILNCWPKFAGSNFQEGLVRKRVGSRAKPPQEDVRHCWGGNSTIVRSDNCSVELFVFCIFWTCEEPSQKKQKRTWGKKENLVLQAGEPRVQPSSSSLFGTFFGKKFFLHFFYMFWTFFWHFFLTLCRRTRSCSPRRLKTPSPPRFIFLGRQTTSPVLSGNQIKKFWKSINSCSKILENIFVNIWSIQRYSQISRSNLVIMSNLVFNIEILIMFWAKVETFWHRPWKWICRRAIGELGSKDSTKPGKDRRETQCWLFPFVNNLLTLC